MIQKLKYKNKEFVIKIESDNEKYNFIINDMDKLKLRIDEINKNCYLLSIDNRNIQAFIAGDDNNIYVSIEGFQYIFNKNDELSERSFKEIPTKNIDKQIVKAPMPGNIIKLKFSKGDKVSEGDCLLIIEAMKMELSVYSNIDGEISEMNVTEGETVDTDKTLAVIKGKE